MRTKCRACSQSISHHNSTSAIVVPPLKHPNPPHNMPSSSSTSGSPAPAQPGPKRPAEQLTRTGKAKAYVSAAYGFWQISDYIFTVRRATRWSRWAAFLYEPTRPSPRHPPSSRMASNATRIVLATASPQSKHPLQSHSNMQMTYRTHRLNRYWDAFVAVIGVDSDLHARFVEVDDDEYKVMCRLVSDAPPTCSHRALTYCDS